MLDKRRPEALSAKPFPVAFGQEVNQSKQVCLRKTSENLFDHILGTCLGREPFLNNCSFHGHFTTLCHRSNACYMMPPGSRSKKSSKNSANPSARTGRAAGRRPCPPANTETVAADAGFRPGPPRPESAREPVQGALGQAGITLYISAVGLRKCKTERFAREAAYRPLQWRALSHKDYISSYFYSGLSG